MARLPNLAVKASKARISFPRLPKSIPHLSYTAFLMATYKMALQNKIGLGLAGKKAIDDEFKSQLLEIHGHNEKLCKTHLQEMNSTAAMAMWDKLQDRSGHVLGIGGSALRSSDVEQLKLPGVGMSVKGDNEKGNCWQYQTYSEFAKKTEKMNQDVVFTKKLMDDSFQKAVSLVASKATRTSGGRTARNVSGINQMLDRCLGSESDKYWEARE